MRFTRCVLRVTLRFTCCVALYVFALRVACCALCIALYGLHVTRYVALYVLCCALRIAFYALRVEVCFALYALFVVCYVLRFTCCA